jgi:hypothetical protein
MALAQVSVVNDVHEVDHQVFQGQSEHAIDRLVVFWARAARGIRVGSHVYLKFKWLADRTLFLLDVRRVDLVEQESESECNHVCKLLLAFLVEELV